MRTWREMLSEKVQVDKSASLKVAMLTSGMDCSVVALKRGNARGARGAGRPLYDPFNVANRTRDEPWGYRGRRQPSLGGTSRMTGDRLVRICESSRVKFLRSTRRLDRRGGIAGRAGSDNRQREDLIQGAKPFGISKREVWEAYKKVKANRGAAGVDGQSIEEFERALEGNLYKLWNRLASGSYHPPPVRRVEIPKESGGTRPLGIPTVSDRVAQMVVKQRLEPQIDPHFHRDSYGYRPGRSAHQAIAVARERCWRFDWVLDLDIKGFFDNIDHALLMRAVRRHTQCRWMLLYIERWLKAPVQMTDGTLVQRDKGTPQGGVITPLTQKVISSLSV